MSQDLSKEIPLNFNSAISSKIRKSIFSDLPNIEPLSLLEEAKTLLEHYHLDKIQSELISLDMYYVLMLTRNIHPQYFPTHDQCFFAAEVLKTFPKKAQAI